MKKILKVTRSKKMFIVAFLVLSFILAISSGQALAAQASGSVFVDWNNISVSGGTLDLTNLVFTTSASTYKGFPATLTATDATSATGPQATASALVSGYQTTAAVTAGPTGTIIPSSLADIKGVAKLTYDASSAINGAITITIPYTFTYFMDASSAGDIYSQIIKLSLFADLTRSSVTNANASTGEEIHISPVVEYPNTDSKTINGNFVYTINGFFTNDEICDFTLESKANVRVAATPVPAAIWLLGSGLVGVIGIRRRKNV